MKANYADLNVVRLTTTAILLALSTTVYAQSSFHAPRSQPLQNYTSLECAPFKATSSDRHDPDPIYKIVVTLILNDDQRVEDLTVIHHARSGAKFNRADQYIHSNLSQVAGNTQFYWTGTWARRPSFTMKGELTRSINSKWTYSEQQFEYGRLRYAMLSVCHVVNDEVE